MPSPSRPSSSSPRPDAPDRSAVPPPRTLSPAAKARRRALRRRRQTIVAGALGLIALGVSGAVALKRRTPDRVPLVSPLPPANARIAAAEKSAQVQTCDVAVLGGTPSGVAAALSAARAGAKVVLVEPRPLLGGDMTYAWINQFDVPVKSLHSTHSPVDYGIFGEFYHELGIAFPPERARDLVEQKIKAEPNIQVLRLTSIEHLGLEEGRLTNALLLENGQKWIRLRATAWVDASNDGDTAAKTGSGFFLGREQANADRAMQAAGLFFKLKNVNWERVREYVTSTKTVSLDHSAARKVGASTSTDMKVTSKNVVLRLGGGTADYAWERGDVVKGYVPHGRNIEIMSINLGRTSKDEAILNTLNIFGVNGLTRFSRIRARKEAVEELKFLVPYLRTHMPGLEKAELAGAAPELYIRETRHISGISKLTAEDVKNSTMFPDRIGLCSYSMDLHPYKRHEKVVSGTRRWIFTLPLSSLVPLRVDGLFVASRSLSATWMAAGAARVIPVTMAAGQAAGLCAAMCAQYEISPHDFARDEGKVAELQEALRKAGVDVGDNATQLAEEASQRAKAS